MIEFDQLKRILEAALHASPQPLSTTQLATIFEEDAAPPREDLARALQQLREDCAGRGIELVEVASGFRYQVREDVHPFVSRLWTERQTRYSRALLETLALIAYRQPVTRGEIEQVRGVGVASSIIRTLEERDWVRVVGYRDVPGKPALLGTTRAFLDYFKLKSLDELPALGELRELADPDPQLALPTDAPLPAARPDAAEDEAAEDHAADPATAGAPDAPVDAGDADHDPDSEPLPTPTPETTA